jgi:hypothetical protein
MHVRHKKTGNIYAVFALQVRESDLAPLVAYQSVQGGPIWTRPAKEFFDGRFEVYIAAQGEMAGEPVH